MKIGSIPLLESPNGLKTIEVYLFSRGLRINLYYKNGARSKLAKPEFNIYKICFSDRITGNEGDLKYNGFLLLALSLDNAEKMCERFNRNQGEIHTWPVEI